MRLLILFSLMLNYLLLQVAAQEEVPDSASATPTKFVATPTGMTAAESSSLFSSLATSAPQQPGAGPSAGDVGSSAGSGDTDAGASGHDSGSITLSQNGLIAIVVVIVLVCVFGIASSILWYLAKKRSWEVRKKLRSSARRVATALTPRRTTFPKDVQRRSTRGLAKIDEVPNTPRVGSVDVEKGLRAPKMKTFEMSEPPVKSKWGQKLGR